MSKVAIQGNASGTGTFTIAAPNSNTDRTLTLPDEAGTVLTSASDLTGITGTGTLTGADIWRITADWSPTSNGDVLDTGWERADTDNSGLIGSGISESSGVFTFPETGIWAIYYQAVIYMYSNSTYYTGLTLQMTSDNGSNWSTASDNFQTLPYFASQYTYASATGFHLFDVTSVSTDKVRLTAAAQDPAVSFAGTTGATSTGITFIRLGDT